MYRSRRSQDVGVVRFPPSSRFPVSARCSVDPLRSAEIMPIPEHSTLQQAIFSIRLIANDYLKKKTNNRGVPFSSVQVSSRGYYPLCRCVKHHKKIRAQLKSPLQTVDVSKVRHLLKQGKSVEGMVGRAVADYIQDNNIAQRVSGRQKWTVEVRAPPRS